MNKSSFCLFASPAVNIFSNDADPIRLDHRKRDYLVRPSGQNPRHYQVYSVEKVTGFVQGTAKEKTYAPFDMFSAAHSDVPVYYSRLRHSPVNSGLDVYLSFTYPRGPNSIKQRSFPQKFSVPTPVCRRGFRQGISPSLPAPLPNWRHLIISRRPQTIFFRPLEKISCGGCSPICHSTTYPWHPPKT